MYKRQDIDVAMNDSLFYKVLSETIGMDIKGDYELISIDVYKRQRLQYRAHL